MATNIGSTTVSRFKMVMSIEGMSEKSHVEELSNFGQNTTAVHFSAILRLRVKLPSHSKTKNVALCSSVLSTHPNRSKNSLIANHAWFSSIATSREFG
jgi:hypothetical protein